MTRARCAFAATVVGVAFNIGHETKEFDIAKQELVFTGVVAVRRDHHVAGTVQDALGLGQVVALQQGFRRRLVKAREHLLLWQIGVQPGAYVLGTDLALELVTERLGHGGERGGTALWARD